MLPGATAAAVPAAGCWAKALAAGKPAPSNAASAAQAAMVKRRREVKLRLLRMLSPLSLFLNADYLGSEAVGGSGGERHDVILLPTYRQM
jgi:hypothetical protein